jgi:phosphoribosylformylglycinamidine synthase subunit PurQ / glutaminase
MSSKLGLVRFPGSNCDKDTERALSELFNVTVEWIDFRETRLPNGLCGLVLPGGFSFGDALRAGALAARTKIIHDVINKAKSGLPVLGVCNGFQILCETELLPGVLLRNKDARFVCRHVDLCYQNQTIRMPIAHGEGRYFADEDTVKKLQDNGEVYLSYTQNPNGSVADIAGLKVGNIMGMMPHPERAYREDGAKILKDFLGSCQ